MSIASAIYKSGSGELRDKDKLEQLPPPDSEATRKTQQLAIEYQQWLMEAPTINFLADLETQRINYLTLATQLSTKSAKDDSLRVYLIKAKTLEEVINYARGNTGIGKAE